MILVPTMSPALAFPQLIGAAANGIVTIVGHMASPPWRSPTYLPDGTTPNSNVRPAGRVASFKKGNMD
jgi:hypothetical protein